MKHQLKELYLSTPHVEQEHENQTTGTHGALLPNWLSIDEPRTHVHTLRTCSLTPLPIIHSPWTPLTTHITPRELLYSHRTEMAIIYASGAAILLLTLGLLYRSTR